ncbi:MAG: hypothetical protein GEU95_05300 [Rhizobiales bacterium]|nr:hypothetical protein [Hyphomicrobiales bacterium]
MRICRSCKPRRRSVDAKIRNSTTRNSDAFALQMPSDREIVFTRVFDAPAQRVFDAWTKPEHLVCWYGCRTSSLIVCDVDLRVGGAYHFVVRMTDGAKHPISGKYREIAPPTRLVFTERFNSDPNKEALVTLTLDEHDGKTTLTMRALYRVLEDRNAMLDIGVDKGAAETLDRLAQHLETMT